VGVHDPETLPFGKVPVEDNFIPVRRKDGKKASPDEVSDRISLPSAFIVVISGRK